ncbi:MAG TPA: hypothetical protein VJ990_00775 [Clostridia bacterium]|nr:hypothetical protein [Clostridia bacterium]
MTRFVSNINDKSLSDVQGKHWGQKYYDVLGTYAMPFNGYNNDTIKQTAITRGRVAQIVAAKNGFNLTEEQAIYYMYENDLSTGMVPGELSFNSYGANDPLRRDQAVTFLQRLNNAGLTKFKGEPSPVAGTELAGIDGVALSGENVDFGDFVVETPLNISKITLDGKTYDFVEFSDIDGGIYDGREVDSVGDLYGWGDCVPLGTVVETGDYLTILMPGADATLDRGLRASWYICSLPMLEEELEFRHKSSYLEESIAASGDCFDYDLGLSVLKTYSQFKYHGEMMDFYTSNMSKTNAEWKHYNYGWYETGSHAFVEMWADPIKHAVGIKIWDVDEIPAFALDYDYLRSE